MIQLRPLMTRFLTSEEGAITIETLPIMAAGVAIAFGMIGLVSGGAENLSGEMSDTLGTYEIATSFAPEAAPAPAPEVVRISARVGLTP